MIKILQITNKVPFPPKDGGAMAVLNMAKGLQNEGVQVSLFTFNTNKHYQDVSSFDVKKLPYEHIWTVDLNTSTTSISAAIHTIFYKEPHHVSKFRSTAFYTSLSSVLNQFIFDLIQIESLYLLQYMPFVKKYLNIPVVYRAHNIEHEIWMRKSQNEKNIFKRFFLKRFAQQIFEYEISMVNQFDLLLSISNKDLSFFKGNGLSKPSMVATVGMSLPVCSETESKLDLFYIGALDWIPNQEGLLWFLKNCWSSVIAEFPDLLFHVAGRNAPNWLVQQLEPVENLVFHGEVSDSAEFIAQHGVSLVPLFSGSGMRVKIAEGLNMGKPVVTTSVGIEGLEEAIDRRAVLLADSPLEWIEAIKKLLLSTDLRIAIGENAQRFAREYLDLKIISNQTIEFYKKHIQ